MRGQLICFLANRRPCSPLASTRTRQVLLDLFLTLCRVGVDGTVRPVKAASIWPTSQVAQIVARPTITPSALLAAAAELQMILDLHPSTEHAPHRAVDHVLFHSPLLPTTPLYEPLVEPSASLVSCHRSFPLCTS